MPRVPKPPLNPDEIKYFAPDEIESAYNISQEQLINAKLFTNREEYAKSLPKGISYLEVGVAWGYSAKLFIETSSAREADLLDNYDQDLKCWSWRSFGSCQCEGMKHELLYTRDTHEQYIKDLFSYHGKVNTIKGKAQDTILNIDKKYDFIYIDITNERNITRKVLQDCSTKINDNGIIGLNDYLIYDGVIDGEPYGTFQTVNEFLHNNKNWVVDGLALHPLGFYDIYIKKMGSV
jgi:hypothetical protein